MPKGDILVSPTHQFDSGEIHKKYFILLSDPAKASHYVVAITTSQKKWRSDKVGCHSNEKGEGYYVFKKRDDWFPAETTWVLFDSIKVLSFDRVLSEHFKKNLQRVSSLKEQNLRAIINCIKECPFVNGFIVDLIK